MKRTIWRILIIDDSRADADLLRRNLQRIPDCDPQVTIQHSATGGERELSNSSWDCVLLDYRLGAVSGLDVLQAIRSRGNDVPIVFLTGYGNEKIAVEAMKRGAQDYLAKDSVAPQVLRRALSNAIHRVALERRFREKQRELEHFVSVVAHDLQQPLCAVRGNMELIRDFYAAKLDDAGRGFVHSAIDMAGRMSAMIEALLAYSRVGRSGKALRSVDLNACMEAVISGLAQAIGKSGGKVIHEGLPTVEGDEQALVQLFQNLVANGLKFRDEEDPVVTVSANAEGDHWHIVVRDNGIGIDPKHHEEIFAPFMRLHSRTEYEGTGIGLATCKRIIDQHHGRIWLESEPGKGSAFHFTLRAAKQPAAASEAVESACVLVVAVDDEMVGLLTEELHQNGLGALHAGGIDEALNLLDRHPVDVVIADVPPDGSGPADCISEIHGLYPSIGLIALTGGHEGGEGVELQRARRAGAELVFPKPLEIEKVIRAACELAAARQRDQGLLASAPVN